MVAQLETPPPKVIPAVTEPPLVGMLFKHNNDRLNLYEQVARLYGDIAQYHYGPFRFVQMNAPDLVHAVLVEHTQAFDKGSALHNTFEPLIGKGLFISEGELHRRQRKLMAPSFQPRHIISYADAMSYYGEQIQASWQDGEHVDIGHAMTQVTMSIVGKALFDANVFTEADELGEAMSIILGHVGYAFSHLVIPPLSWPTPHNRRVRQAIALMDTRIQEMIEDRRQSGEERNDFLSILLRAQEEDGSHMSDQQLRDESLTLFGAGHETTATALTWAWYLLTQNPEKYQRMQDEVDMVLRGRTPTYADLAQLPYALQVFKETLRLYPPAYAVSRVALQDVQVAGYPLRKNDVALMAIWAIHRRADFFPEPWKFEPERFTPEKERLLPRYAYMPFGAGPRICIGNHFALMEGQLLLATLVQRVRFELVPEQEIIPDPTQTLTIRPRHSLRAIVHRR